MHLFIVFKIILFYTLPSTPVISVTKNSRRLSLVRYLLLYKWFNWDVKSESSCRKWKFIVGFIALFLVC